MSVLRLFASRNLNIIDGIYSGVAGHYAYVGKFGMAALYLGVGLVLSLTIEAIVKSQGDA